MGEDPRVLATLVRRGAGEDVSHIHWNETCTVRLALLRPEYTARV